MSSVDVAALQAQVTALQAQVAQLVPPPLPQTYSPPPAKVEARPTAIYTLVGNPQSGYLHRDPREVRRTIEALALSKHVDSPLQTVPPAWVPPLRKMAAARAEGSSWHAALAAVGHEAPDDLESPARAARAELDALWDAALAVIGFTLDSSNDIVKEQLKTFLRRALS